MPAPARERPQKCSSLHRRDRQQPQIPPLVSTHGSPSTQGSTLAGCGWLLCPGRGVRGAACVCWCPHSLARGRDRGAMAIVTLGCCRGCFKPTFELTLKCSNYLAAAGLPNPEQTLAAPRCQDVFAAPGAAWGNLASAPRAAPGAAKTP